MSELSLDLAGNSVSFGEKSHKLQAQEAECLYALSKAITLWVTTEEIMRAIWGAGRRPTWANRKVANYVGMLRRKLGVWGFEIEWKPKRGYLLKYTGRTIDPNAKWLVRWTKEQREKLLELHGSGMRPEQISRQMKIAKSRILAAIRQHVPCGLERPGYVRPRPAWSAERIEDLRRALRVEGISPLEAAKRFKTTPGSIYGAIRRHLRTEVANAGGKRNPVRHAFASPVPADFKGVSLAPRQPGTGETKEASYVLAS